MGATAPDGLPFPIVGDMADVPTDMEELARATQTALDARAYAARSIVAGNGLNGGGMLGADVTLDVGQGNGIIVNPNDIELDWALLNSVYSNVSHTHPYAPASHTHDYAPSNHSHTPSRAGITQGDWNVGTLTAGQEKAVDITVPANARIFITIAHTSTYLFAVAHKVSATVARIEIRNGTASTTHSNIHVSYLIVIPG